MKKDEGRREGVFASFFFALKVLLLTDGMEIGGAETHLATLARGLRKNGTDVVLLSDGGTLADELETEGIRQYRFGIPEKAGRKRLDLPWILLQKERIFRRVLQTEYPDVIHAHTRQTAFLLRGIPKSIRKRKAVVTVHARFKPWGILSGLFYWGEETVAVSRDLKEYLCRRYQKSPDRVSVIPNGIDTDYFSPVKEKSEDKHPFFSHTDEKILLFVSRLDIDCSLGAELLCDVIEKIRDRFPDTVVWIAGGGNALSGIRERADLIRRRTGSETVRLLGRVDDLRELYRSAFVTVGVSRAAMEAAACGCPVILCGNEGYGGVLSQKRSAFARSNFCCRGEALPTAEKLEADVLFLLEHPGIRKELSRKNREWMCEDFSARRMCRQTQILYEKLWNRYPKRICIGGYAGCGNLGDDAVLEGFLGEMKRRYPGVGITVLSGDPKKDAKRWDVACINRKDPIAVRKAIRRSDAFFLGGGTLLQNLTGNRSLAFYLSGLYFAQKAFVKPIVYAAGIGPIEGEFAWRMTKKRLNSCRSISLRDERSGVVLREKGISERLLTFGADPAFLLPEVTPAEADRFFGRFFSGGVPDYCCFVCAGKTEKYEGLLEEFFSFCETHGFLPLVLAMDVSDVVTARSIEKQAGVRVFSGGSAGETLCLFSRSFLTVGMRLHALIFSVKTGVPCFGVRLETRDEKMRSFGMAAGVPVLDVDGLQKGKWTDWAETMLSQRRAESERLNLLAADYRKKAEKDLANQMRMLYNRDQKFKPKGINRHESSATCRPASSTDF